MAFLFLYLLSQLFEVSYPSPLRHFNSISHFLFSQNYLFHLILYYTLLLFWYFFPYFLSMYIPFTNLSVSIFFHFKICLSHLNLFFSHFFYYIFHSRIISYMLIFNFSFSRLQSSIFIFYLCYIHPLFYFPIYFPILDLYTIECHYAVLYN